jgi:hypothetical protein
MPCRHPAKPRTFTADAALRNSSRTRRQAGTVDDPATTLQTTGALLVAARLPREVNKGATLDLLDLSLRGIG